jgi:metallo-beta-lactamase class B
VAKGISFWSATNNGLVGANITAEFLQMVIFFNFTFMRTILTFIITLTLQQSIAQSNTRPLLITPLTNKFYVYTTYGQYKGAPVPANGMYVVTDSGVVIFDTPWDSTQFQPLLDSIAVRHHKRAIISISTHFHADRTAGLTYFAQHGIATYTTRLTDSISIKNDNNRATYLLAGDTIFTVGQYQFQTYYPGPGHAPDNIIVWFEKEKILYGGCLIKSTAAKNLGYLGDANIQGYASTIKNVMEHCANPKHVITGHDSWRTVRSLQHTYRLAKKLRKQNNS